jgi:hypothetical protein
MSVHYTNVNTGTILFRYILRGLYSVAVAGHIIMVRQSPNIMAQVLTIFFPDCAL